MSTKEYKEPSYNWPSTKSTCRATDPSLQENYFNKQ